MPAWLPMSWSVQMCGWFQGGDGPGLALEPPLQVGVQGDMFGQHLDSDGAVQAGVAGLVDLAHAVGAEGGFDLVGAERGAGLQGHGYGTGTRSSNSWAQGRKTLPSSPRVRSIAPLRAGR